MVIDAAQYDKTLCRNAKLELALARLLAELRVNTDTDFYNHCKAKTAKIMGEEIPVMCRGCGNVFDPPVPVTCTNCGCNL